MSFRNKADKEWQTNWPTAKEEKWDKDSRKLFTNIEKDVRGGWLRNKEVKTIWCYFYNNNKFILIIKFVTAFY